MLLSVMLLRAWAQLSSGAQNYDPMTDDQGMPRARVKRTLFTRIFDEETLHKINTSTVGDVRLNDSIRKQVATYAKTLDRVARWHKALRDAYYRLPNEERFLPEAIEPLFVPAWDAAVSGEAPNIPTELAAKCDTLIDGLARRQTAFSTAGVKSVLSDQLMRDDLERILESAWEDIGITPQPDGAARSELLDAVRIVCELMRGDLSVADTADLEAAWKRLNADVVSGALFTPQQLSLTQSELTRPLFLKGEQDKSELSLEARPFYPLEKSVLSRIERILANPPASFPSALSSWDALERAAWTSAEPLALKDSGARATIIAGSAAYIGVGASPRARSIAVPTAAARYLAESWRRTDAVRQALRHDYNPRYAPVFDYIADPIAYLMGRLWIRVSRTDFDGETIISPADAWGHLKGAVTSSIKEVTGLIQNIERVNPRFYYIDDQHVDGDGYLQPRSEIQYVEKGFELQLKTGSTFSQVIDCACRTDGARTVEQFVLSASKRGMEALRAKELQTGWERWVRTLADERVTRGVQTGGIRSDATIEREIRNLPSFEQAVAHIRANSARSEDKSHLAGPPSSALSSVGA